MILSLGLIDSSPTKFNKNLLSIRLSIFKFLNSLIYETGVFKKKNSKLGYEGNRMNKDWNSGAAKNLFPSLNESQVFNLSNKALKYGPINCAADDLDLSLGGADDQIEFFNNFVVTGSNQQHNSSSVSSSLVGSNDFILHQASSDYQPNNHGQQHHRYQQPHQPSHQQIPLNGVQQGYQFDHFYDFDFNGKSASNNQVIDNFSHYNLNMIGLNNGSSYFNDFNNNGKQCDQASLYGSSNESFISPLDEEFFKKLNNNQSNIPLSRKRKFDSVASASSDGSMVQSDANANISSLQSFYDVDNILNDILIKTQSDYEYVPQRIQQKESTQSQEHSKDLRSIPKKKHKKCKKLRCENDLSSDLNFKCPHCDAKFKVKGYLTRHLKKHNSSKAFVCPFYQEPSDGSSGSKCHPTGGFSRRDTYKTHLKALHFIYPPGTKSNERNLVSGRCAGCFNFFENNFKWLEKHIETGDCDGTVIYKKMKEQKVNEDLSHPLIRQVD